ncbi:reverse transcriptase domain-containing protein [Tanacetum coccineum]
MLHSSKTTNLRNEITNFQQRFDESFCEAWDRFKDLLRACPHHGFTELNQLDTFYNALTPTDQDSLNAAAGGNILTKTPRDAFTIIENKSKVFNLRNKPIVTKVSTNAPSSSTPHSPEIVALVDALVECLALADLGASINLMPLSIWKKLSLTELTPTQMILELADRSTTSPSVDDEAITFKIGQTSRYPYNDAVSINRINVIDVSCEEYTQEVLGLSDSSTSGNPTPSLDHILSTSSPSLTPFEEGDFILEEIEACLTNDSIPPGIDDDDFDPEGDLLLLEKLLNDDPSSPLSPKELHVEELKIVKSSINDPP